MTHKSPHEQIDVCGDLIDVSGFSLQDLGDLDRTVLAEELRRLLARSGADADAVGRFKASI